MITADLTSVLEALQSTKVV